MFFRYGLSWILRFVLVFAHFAAGCVPARVAVYRDLGAPPVGEVRRVLVLGFLALGSA